RLLLETQRPVIRRIGWWMLLFALLVQPVLGLLAGRTPMQSGYFGVAPDPTVTATLGVLLLARDPHWAVLVIPLLWCALSGAFQWAMRAPDSLVMPVVGVVTALACAARARWARQASGR